MSAKITDLRIAGAAPREARNLGPVCADIAGHIVKQNRVDGCICITINEGTADMGAAGPAFDGHPDRLVWAYDVLRLMVKQWDEGRGE